ncbi:glycosyltransferase family 4 protein [Roseobacter sp. HKCCA0434]|uniref:glycosyltransferase family 4 protein n=1 Tax=Roseobacter sp. HKCCA0434 TaxID=3079297 RepID=UPI002905DAC3|nr:glycosyltransferase family 4 protein [Roseobacter sp. HKCCA0434]
MSARFAIPGDLDTVSGGYAYDREVLREWPGLRHVALPGGFPTPNARSLERTVEILAEPGLPWLIDGLALGALPEGALDRIAGPYVALCHHPLALETGLEAGRAAALRLTERAALHRAAAVICTSDTTAELLTARYGVAAEAITVAVPGLPPAPMAARGNMPPRILTVASLIPRKGHDVLIEALEQIADLDWRADWIGPAPDAGWLAMLEARIARSGLGDRIHRHPAAGSEALDALRAASDLFCLPSHYEGYGMAFAEAMMSGLPVVACAGGAVTQTVPESAGLLTEPGDARALAGSLRAVLTDPVLAERLAAGGRAHALGQPGWAETAAIIRDVMERVA